MSAESRIKAALDPFGDPVEQNLLYAAAHELPPRYYTFRCSAQGADWGDDEPGQELWQAEIHYFAPCNENVSERVRRTKRALFRAGFTWPASTDASDEDGRHIVFECQITEEVEPDGEFSG